MTLIRTPAEHHNHFSIKPWKYLRITQKEIGLTDSDPGIKDELNGMKTLNREANRAKHEWN